MTAPYSKNNIIAAFMREESRNILLPSTLQLLRFHFSFFLMPVYWFALSQLVYFNIMHTIIVFAVLHLLVYPASNGYNSFMDRDTESIGGIKSPMQPTRQLYHATIVLDSLAVLLSTFVSMYFALGILLYIMVSKAYSYRGVRLKKHPLIAYITVMIFQGAVTFALVYHGCSADKTWNIPVIPMIVASLLIGGFYPLTQIYQHDADIKDGVKTISYLLGYRGTFVFCGIIYTLAFLLLAYYFFYTLQATAFYIFTVGMSPVIIYFFIWAKKAWNNYQYADFAHTMRMNMIASVCTNISFILILIKNYFE
ncbi:MAG: UbiA family prenyltransferase [Agriterribacter sp.]